MAHILVMSIEVRSRDSEQEKVTSDPEVLHLKLKRKGEKFGCSLRPHDHRLVGIVGSPL